MSVNGDDDATKPELEQRPPESKDEKAKIDAAAIMSSLYEKSERFKTSSRSSLTKSSNRLRQHLKGAW